MQKKLCTFYFYYHLFVNLVYKLLAVTSPLKIYTINKNKNKREGGNLSQFPHCNGSKTCK